MKEMSTLSASKISTLKGCSWEYYCKYELKLPDRNNTGSMMGSVCHTLFECLGNPRHRKHFDIIIENDSIEASKACERLLKKGLAKYGINQEEFYSQVKSMTLNGLKYDFFAQRFVEVHGKPDLEEAEIEFNIKVDEKDKKYKIRGFIDRLFLFKQETAALIRDFKSSKKKYNDAEFEENMQNLMYSLAVRHLYPKAVKRHVEFLFLKFPLPEEGVMVGHSLDDDELDGFELYLSSIQKIIDNFSEEAALADTAQSKGFTSDGSFGGLVKCGRAKFAGELKKDGAKMWHCPYKFAFDYYILEDKDGKIVDKCFEDEVERFFDREDEGFKIVKKKYLGCPAFGNSVTKKT